MDAETNRLPPSTTIARTIDAAMAGAQGIRRHPDELFSALLAQFDAMPELRGLRHLSVPPKASQVLDDRVVLAWQLAVCSVMAEKLEESGCHDASPGRYLQAASKALLAVEETPLRSPLPDAVRRAVELMDQVIDAAVASMRNAQRAGFHGYAKHQRAPVAA